MPIAALLLLAAPAAATTVPGGSIGTTTWDVAGSPWIVQGDVTVLSGATLTIEPGVQVRFASSDASGSGLDNSRVELIVDGTLLVNGTAGSPVQMVADSGTASNTWYGVVVNSGGTATVSHAVSEHSIYGFRSAGDLTVTGLDSDRHNTAGVYLTGGTASITDSLFTSGSYGIWSTGGTTLDVAFTEIFDTTSHGIYVNTTGATTTTLDNLTVYSVSGTGIYVVPSSGTPTVTVTDTITTNNSGYGVYRSSGTVNVANTLAWNNGSNDLQNVTQGGGNLFENPLYVSAPSDLALTEYSPARFAADDGSDIGAHPYAGDPTVGLQGTLWGGLTLDLAGSPYTMVGDVTVPAGDTLTVEAGVHVDAATSDSMQAHNDESRVELRVLGFLDVQGTPYEPVRFQSTGTASNSWYGVHFLAGSDGTLTSVAVEEAIYAIRHSTTSDVPMSDLHLSRNNTAGLWVDAGRPAVDGLFVTNGSYGVWMTSGGTADLSNCVIWDTSSHGVYVNTTGSVTASIHSCTIHSVSGTGVYVVPSSGSPTVTFDNAILTSS